MKIIDIHQDLFMTYGQQPEAFFDAQNGLSPDYNVGSYDDYKESFDLVVSAIRPYRCEGDMKDVQGRKISFDESMIEQGLALSAQREQKIPMVRTGSDLNKEGFKTLLHIEGHDTFQSVELLQRWREKGVRSFGWTWNSQTPLAGANGSELGLSPLGFETMEAMNTLGMIIDTAHMGRQGMRELLQHSKKPLLNSHSNVNTLHEHPRNIPDDIIDLFAKNGGVMGISIYSPFITTSGTATIDQYVDQVAYVVNRIGDDHVAFGTDWHGIPKSKTIAGLDSVNGVHLLYETMTARLGSITTNKFFHENAVRVIKANIG